METGQGWCGLRRSRRAGGGLWPRGEEKRQNTDRHRQIGEERGERDY